MQSLALLFFALMVVVLVVMYLSIRRDWFPPSITAAVGIVASIIAMTLVSLAQGNSILQAVVVGILVGSMFGGATLGIAWYFQTGQMRSQYRSDERPPDE